MLELSETNKGFISYETFGSLSQFNPILHKSDYSDIQMIRVYQCGYFPPPSQFYLFVYKNKCLILSVALIQSETIYSIFAYKDSHAEIMFHWNEQD